jgi:hypothetical protein
MFTAECDIEMLFSSEHISLRGSITECLFNIKDYCKRAQSIVKSSEYITSTARTKCDRDVEHCERTQTSNSSMQARITH